MSTTLNAMTTKDTYSKEEAIVRMIETGKVMKIKNGKQFYYYDKDYGKFYSANNEKMKDAVECNINDILVIRDWEIV